MNSPAGCKHSVNKSKQRQTDTNGTNFSQGDLFSIGGKFILSKKFDTLSSDIEQNFSTNFDNQIVYLFINILTLPY